MTADSLNEWYQQILDVSKKIGENFTIMFLCLFFTNHTLMHMILPTVVCKSHK